MAFRDFTFPGVQAAFGLSLAEADLFSAVAPLTPVSEFLERLNTGVEIALAVSTEKARSELIIAPVLLELRRMLHDGFGLFPGVELDVDASRGLNGFCDFILTRSPLQTVLTAPVVAIVEAKNDNIRTGLGQCVAAMVAARELNAASPIPAVHGVVTTGSAWKFLRLEGARLTVDRPEYFIAEAGRVMGILAHLLGGPAPA
jgi:hypothetical protein